MRENAVVVMILWFGMAFVRGCLAALRVCGCVGGPASLAFSKAPNGDEADGRRIASPRYLPGDSSLTWGC